MLTIFIVDDAEAIRDALKFILQSGKPRELKIGIEIFTFSRHELLLKFLETSAETGGLCDLNPIFFLDGQISGNMYMQGRGAVEALVSRYGPKLHQRCIDISDDIDPTYELRQGGWQMGKENLVPKTLWQAIINIFLMEAREREELKREREYVRAPLR